MNVMRFVGRTSREALRSLRETLGPDALVLANRPCAEGVELLAAGLESLAALPLAAGPAGAAPRGAAARPARRALHGADADERRPGRAAAAPVSEDADARAGDAALDGGRGTVPDMSTVSFQDYVRQRLRARSRSADPAPSPAPAPASAAGRGPVPPPERMPGRVARVPDTAGSAAPAGAVAPAPWDAVPAGGPAAGFTRAARAAAGVAVGDAEGRGANGHGAHGVGAAARDTGAVSEALIAELQSLKGSISRQFASLGWFEGVVRSPLQSRLLRTIIASGFSLKLARSVVDRLPADYSERDALTWLERVLARNLHCAAPADAFDSGGVFALVGPTGVGKTTTTAKIAARHVLRHGPRSVALITVDTYRLGAHDQLRAFGRILGVPVHVAHDTSTLHDLLRLRATRQLVVVDTVGMGHRDARIRGLLDALPPAEVRRVVVASCASQAETIDESLRAYEASAADGVVLTKLDEAARLGGALDCVIRQRLRLLGVCDGQRVPEDWHVADPARLVGRALRTAPLGGAFALDQEDLPLVLGIAATRQGDVSHA